MLKRLFPLLLIAGCVAVVLAWAGSRPGDDAVLPAQFRKLLPLHTKLGKARPGEWLAVHSEPGQSYREYVDARPVKPDPPSVGTLRRRVIYVQPLGDFNRTQRQIINLTAEFLGIYFDLPVRIRDELPLRLIPAEARRTHPAWGDKQILTTYVLDEVLQPNLPKDACVLIALTTADLWPGEGWNFVFGQASLRDRVGVWSIYRNGDPSQGDEAFRLCLRRTIKTASHETGHMFSMMHCTLYECNMCGSNHRAESDRRPLALCPHCLAKLCYATGADPEKRFEKLIAFCKANGLKPEQEFYQKSLQALRGQ